MKFNHFIVLGFLLSLFFNSCSEKIEVNFSYSPEMPKTGQKVSFTNTTTGKDDDWEAEYWNWEFGDGGKSTIKNPTYIYKKSGKYTIKLRVDSNDNYIKTLDITVYDSIPTVYINTDSVKYYQESNFSVLIYNPNSLSVTYEWIFSENAKSKSLVNRKTTDASLDVYFDKKNVEEEVSVRVIMEDELDTVITYKFYVHDVKSRSVLMAQQNGKILRQRIFDKGTEDFMTTEINSGKHPFNIYSNKDNLYIFDAGTKTGLHTDWQTDISGDGSIKVIDLTTKQETEIINNAGLSSRFGFVNGYVDQNYIYWTDWADFLYRTPLNSTLGKFTWKGNDEQTTLPYYLVKTNRLGYFGNGISPDQLNGGILYYDQAYFWAKGGNGRGLYRFLASDILGVNTTGNVPAPSLGAILTDFAIRAFTIDRVNLKIYFSVTAPADKVGFWVSNLNGSGAKRIDDAPVDDENLYITGIAIDNNSNTVLWAYRSPETLGKSAPNGTWESYYNSNPTHRTGVKQASLATAFKTAGAVKYFAPGVAAYGISLDDVKR